MMTNEEILRGAVKTLTDLTIKGLKDDIERMESALTKNTTDYARGYYEGIIDANKHSLIMVKNIEKMVEVE